jgi:hypothetical protein
MGHKKQTDWQKNRAEVLKLRPEQTSDKTNGQGSDTQDYDWIQNGHVPLRF